MKKVFAFIIFFVFCMINLSYSKKSLSLEKFKIQKISDTINYPWGMSLLDEKNILVTSKKGNIYFINLVNFYTKKIHKIIDTKPHGQGGLLDIMNLKINSTNYVFVCYVDKIDNDVVISRFKLNKLKLLNKKIIFKSGYKKQSSKHFGCRLINYKNTVLFSIGDRGYRDNSQNPNNYPGSIIQISHKGEKLGKKNKGWLEGIFSIGHRNPQGLIVLKEFDQIWSHEHGPKGGDEINVIYKGNNYGWPIVSHGEEYWGGKIGVGVSQKGFEDPVWKWIPSIAPSGIDYYKHSYFTELQGSLLIGSLKFKSLYAVKIINQKPISEFIVFKNKIGRIRDVLSHPKGYILLLNDEYEGGLYKMSKN